MKTRIIHTKFWNDGYIEELSPVEKLLFLYFVTNEAVNIIHCYECSDKRVMYETGCNREQLDRFKEKTERDGKMYFFNGYVYLKNSGKYEQYAGELQDKARENIIKSFSGEIKKWYELLLKDKPPSNPFLRGLKDTEIISHNTEIINKKSEYKDIDSLTNEVCDEVAKEKNIKTSDVKGKVEEIDLYCRSKGKSYKDYKATLLNWINRDLKEGKLQKQTKKIWTPPINKEGLEKIKQMKKEHNL